MTDSCSTCVWNNQCKFQRDYSTIMRISGHSDDEIRNAYTDFASVCSLYLVALPQPVQVERTLAALIRRIDSVMEE